MAAITVKREGAGDLINFDTVAEAGSAADFISYIHNHWGEGVLLKSSASAFMARSPESFLPGIYTFLPKSDPPDCFESMSTFQTYLKLEGNDDVARWAAAVGGGPDVSVRVLSIGEVKRKERLCLLSSDCAIDMELPPNLPAIWNDRLEETLVVNTNVVAVVAQVNGYAGIHGVRYGMISNGLWSWVFRNE